MRQKARLWSPEVRQIDLDVNRTYRDHIMFRERYGIKQKELFHVLGTWLIAKLKVEIAVLEEGLWCSICQASMFALLEICIGQTVARRI